MTKSMHTALRDLKLERRLVVHSGKDSCVMNDQTESVSITHLRSRGQGAFPKTTPKSRSSSERSLPVHFTVMTAQSLLPLRGLLSAYPKSPMTGVPEENGGRVTPVFLPMSFKGTPRA